MAFLDYIEWLLSKLLMSQRGRDASLFTKNALFTTIPSNLTIHSPNNGPSGSNLLPECTQVGVDDFPELTWTVPADISPVAEYLLVVEDPDAPLPKPATHAVIWGIPGTTTSITAEDIFLVDRAAGRAKGIKSGWNIGQNLRGTHYGGARPLLEHGPHRYFYQIIALKEPLDPEGKLPKIGAKKDQLVEAIKGKVSGWGAWIGNFERKWPSRSEGK